MNRRESFTKLRNGLAVMVGTALGFCAKLLGASSRWSWPGYPDEKALRNHLATSKNHPEITAASVRGMTFEQCIAAHERSHSRRGDSPRWSVARKTPGTKSGSSAPDYMGNSPKIEQSSNNLKGGRSDSRSRRATSGSSERLTNPTKRRR